MHSQRFQRGYVPIFLSYLAAQGVKARQPRHRPAQAAFVLNLIVLRPGAGGIGPGAHGDAENEHLPPEGKIRVISISRGYHKEDSGYEEILRPGAGGIGPGAHGDADDIRPGVVPIGTEPARPMGGRGRNMRI